MGPGAGVLLRISPHACVQVGIIPTDSLPAVVCDLENRTAALKMYNAMELAPKKQLSILVGSFNDISK